MTEQDQPLTPEELRAHLEHQLKQFQEAEVPSMEALDEQINLLQQEMQPLKVDMTSLAALQKEAQRRKDVKEQLARTQSLRETAQNFLTIQTGITLYDQVMAEANQLADPESLELPLEAYQELVTQYEQHVAEAKIHPILQQLFPQEESSSVNEQQEVTEEGKKRKSKEQTLAESEAMVAKLQQATEPVEREEFIVLMYGEEATKDHPDYQKFIFSFKERLKQVRHLLSDEGYRVINTGRGRRRGGYIIEQVVTQEEIRQLTEEKNLPKVDVYGHELAAGDRRVVLTREEYEVFWGIYLHTGKEISLNELKENRRIRDVVHQSKNSLARKLEELFNEDVIREYVEGTEEMVMFSKQFKAEYHREYHHVPHNRLQALHLLLQTDPSVQDIMNVLGMTDGKKREPRPLTIHNGLAALKNAVNTLYFRNMRVPHLLTDEEKAVMKRLAEFTEHHKLGNRQGVYQYFEKVLLIGSDQAPVLAREQETQVLPFDEKEFMVFIGGVKHNRELISQKLRNWVIEAEIFDDLERAFGEEEFITDEDVQERNKKIHQIRARVGRQIAEFLTNDAFEDQVLRMWHQEIPQHIINLDEKDKERASLMRQHRKFVAMAEFLAAFHEASTVKIHDVTNGHKEVITGFEFIRRVVNDSLKMQKDFSRYLIIPNETVTVEQAKVSLPDPEPEEVIREVPTIVYEAVVPEVVDTPEEDEDDEARAQQKLEERLQRLGKKLNVPMQQMIQTCILDVAQHRMLRSPLVNDSTMNNAFPVLTQSYVASLIEKKVISPKSESGINKYTRSQIVLLVFLSRTSTKGLNLEAKEYKFIRKYIQGLMNPTN